MKLYFYDTDTNFGDAMNGWLWERLLPDVFDEDARVRFSGIGTILNDSMPAAERWIVFTSGVGYPPLPRGFGDRRWSVISVRGPLSAAALGLPAAAAVTDGALLLATLPEYAPLPSGDRTGVVFAPHRGAARCAEWRTVAEKAGVEYLDPLAESREVIARLRRAKLVLADAMHAAIVADAMRVPWIPLATSTHTNSFKWLDWTLSMGVPYEPVRLPPPTLSGRIRGAMFAVTGDNYEFDSANPERALRQFQRSNAVRRQPWWPMVRRIGLRLRRHLERQAHRPGFARWRPGSDGAMLDRCAQALARAAAGPSFLSDETVFENRLDTLQSRLKLVRSAGREANLHTAAAPQAQPTTSAFGLSAE